MVRSIDVLRNLEVIMRGISIVTVALAVLAVVQVHDMALRPAMGSGCSLAAGAPNQACVGDDIAIVCGTCEMWWPKDGKTWSNTATRGTVPGGWTPIYTPVTCYTVTPCVGGIRSPIKYCPVLGGLCRAGLDACTDYAAGAPVVTTYSTVTNGPCTEG